jgi:signal transduction histidine kinase
MGAPVNDVSRAALVPIPLERELEERLGWLVGLRWVAGGGLVAGAVLGLPLLGLSLPDWPLAAVGASVLAYNAVLFVTGRALADRLGSFKRAAHLQIALDWGALTAAVSLTGGIASPAAVGFVFHLIVAAILLSRRATYLLATAAVIVTAWFAFQHPSLEAAALSARSAAGPPRTPWALQVWAALSCLFGVTSYLATSITTRLRRKEAELAASEQSLARSYREMEALHHVGQLVNSTLDLDEVLRLIAQHAAVLLHGKAALIRLLDRRGETLSVSGSFGLSDAYVMKGPVDVENSVIDAEALEGRVVQALDVTNDPRFQYRDAARDEGLRSMLSCPMRTRNRPLGVLRVYTGEVRAFTTQQERLLLNLADLGAVAIANARAYGDLLDLDRQRVWFARTTHHQLRAPLAAVQGAVDAMEFAGPLNGAQQELAARARRRIQDSFDIVRDLLDLAAAQSLGTSEEMGEACLADALRRPIESAQERCRVKGVDLTVDLGPPGLAVRMATPDLERVLGNLLDNAVKYTRKGRISLRVTGSEAGVEVLVADTGIGIAPDDLPRIFDNFFRATSAKESGEVGTGLGLAIVKTLMENAGGSIAVESEPGRGTRVTITFPPSGASPMPGVEPQLVYTTD